jgi:hypothetical protein
MKSRLLVVLGVLMALLVSEAAARMAITALPGAEQWPTLETEIKSRQLSELAEAEVEIDVLFLGSSAVEAGLDPTLFDSLVDATSYNAAHPFSSPLSNEIWLEEVVLPHIQPSIVIIGLGVWPYESTLENDLLYAELERITIENHERTGLAVIDRREQIRSWSDSVKRVEWVRSGVITGRGLQTSYEDLVVDPDGLPRFDDSLPAQMSKDNLSALERTVELLQARSTEVVILLEPTGCPPATDVCRRYDPESHPGRILADQFGLTLIDASVRGWPPEMYADSAHFNRNGTIELTRFVAGELLELVGMATGSGDYGAPSA